MSASSGPGDVNNGEPDTMGTVGPYGPKESGSNAGPPSCKVLSDDCQIETPALTTQRTAVTPN